MRLRREVMARREKNGRVAGEVGGVVTSLRGRCVSRAEKPEKRELAEVRESISHQAAVFLAQHRAIPMRAIRENARNGAVDGALRGEER